MEKKGLANLVRNRVRQNPSIKSGTVVGRNFDTFSGDYRVTVDGKDIPFGSCPTFVGAGNFSDSEQVTVGFFNPPKMPIILNSKKKQSRHVGPILLKLELYGVWTDVYSSANRNNLNYHSSPINLNIEVTDTITLPAFIPPDKWETTRSYPLNYTWQSLNSTTRIVKDTEGKEYLYIFRKGCELSCVRVEDKTVIWRHTIQEDKHPAGVTSGSYDYWANIETKDSVLVDTNYIYIFVNRVNYKKYPAVDIPDPEDPDEWKRFYYPYNPGLFPYYASMVSGYSYFYIIDHSGKFVGCSAPLRIEVLGGTYYLYVGRHDGSTSWYRRPWDYPDFPDYLLVTEVHPNDLPYWYSLDKFGVLIEYNNIEIPEVVPPDILISKSGSLFYPANGFVNNPTITQSIYTSPAISEYDGKNYITISRVGSKLTSPIPNIPTGRQASKEQRYANITLLEQNIIIESFVIDVANILSLSSITKIQEMGSVYWSTVDYGIPEAGWHIYTDRYFSPILHNDTKCSDTIVPGNITTIPIGKITNEGVEQFIGYNLRKKTNSPGELIASIFSGPEFINMYFKHSARWYESGDKIENYPILFTSYDLWNSESEIYGDAGVVAFNSSGNISWWAAATTASWSIPSDCTEYGIKSNFVCVTADSSGILAPKLYWCWYGRKVVIEGEDPEDPEYYAGYRTWVAIRAFNWHGVDYETLLSPEEGWKDDEDQEYITHFLSDGQQLIGLCNIMGYPPSFTQKVKIYSLDVEFIKENIINYSQPDGNIWSIGKDRLYNGLRIIK